MRRASSRVSTWERGTTNGGELPGQRCEPAARRGSGPRTAAVEVNAADGSGSKPATRGPAAARQIGAARGEERGRGRDALQERRGRTPAAAAPPATDDERDDGGHDDAGRAWLVARFHSGGGVSAAGSGGREQRSTVAGQRDSGQRWLRQRRRRWRRSDAGGDDGATAMMVTVARRRQRRDVGAAAATARWHVVGPIDHRRGV
ncbi:hypothetical protein Scep_019707 [Stephania cephalantha]|uniref:Uncharacterized protein n=1 Tax=Stephania cephalantha TaxID=152367 RepID=A0AAP0IBP4_9MAGN